MMKIFSDIALAQVPRILGFIDRDPLSRTYGCCDRAFWHYKTMDFPNARFQEAALVLTLASLLAPKEHPFYRSSSLDAHAMAAIAFWAKHVHRNGSVDESYPYERHFCATAFTLYAVSESVLIGEKKLPWDLDHVGCFLIKNRNTDVSNQMACAAEALHNLFLLTGNKKFEVGSQEKIDQLLLMQNTRGAFCEYAGFDLGYDTITLSFLAGLHKKTKREDVKKSALRAIDHIAGHIEEDGYYAPGLMSRQTQFFYPYGFSYFASDLLTKVEKGLKNNVLLNPSWLDDRYCIPLTANYLRLGLGEVTI
jgi:hypothetical protein